MKMNKDTTPNGNRTHDNILAFARLSEGQKSKVAVSISDGELFFSASEDFTKFPGTVLVLTNLQQLIHGVARPLSMFTDPENNKPMQMSIGSIPVDLGDPLGISRTLMDIALIEDITQNVKSTDKDTYTVGRAGKMNFEKGAITIRAGSDMELALKVMAALHPGISDDLSKSVQIDIHEAGRIDVRTLSDWEKVDIDDLIARAKDEIEINLETEGPSFEI
jgi:hypothetical protein